MSARESIIPVFIPHLGCPNNCVFCNQRKISGTLKPADGMSVRLIADNALKLLPEDSRKQIAFYGGSFTAIPVEEQTELLETAQSYIDRGLVSTIRLSTRPDAISGEILERLKYYSVETIEIGAQSLDEAVLIKAGRGHTAQQVEQAARLIKEYDFKLIIQMMTGLPGDDGSASKNTAQRIISMKPDGVRIYPTVIIKDTALFELWESGKYKEHTVEDAVEVCSEILPLFEAAEIPVIRLGLNPTDDLSSGEAVGGAYHPALGELVLSRIMLKKARKLLCGTSCTGIVRIGISAKKVSQLVGQHRCNIDILKREFLLDDIKVIPLENEAGEPVLL